MKRDRATSLLKEILARLDAGAWLASLVQEVHVFASYARGVLELVDADVAVTHGTDEAFTADSAGGNVATSSPRPSTGWRSWPRTLRQDAPRATT
ncbi:hypothetical protein [Streptomyces umbrinus]|uniref:hypothetical protein n=1 Tax=Streptomyces umbrinus TaxID=67370 RepID=UPI00342A1951